jgi:putative two-component system response regulator
MSDEPGGAQVRPPTAEELRRLGFAFQVPEIEDVAVVIVDDDRTSLELAKALVERVGHPVRAFSKPLEALEAIKADPPQILLTDVVMSDLPGVELARAARRVDPDVGVVLMTAYGDQGTAEATMGLDITTLLQKPVGIEELRRALQQAYLQRAADDHHRAMVSWMYESMARNADEVRSVTISTLASLMNVLDTRSPHFRGHSTAVALQSAALAQHLGLDDATVELVRTAGMLHDVGMIAVPDAIVDKSGPLTPEEKVLVRSHCEVAGAILKPMKHIEEATRYVLEHHERLDGSGYPFGKKGDEISLGGQIVGISEAWTAILEDRPHRAGSSRERAAEVLRTHQGQWFTRELTEALLESDVGLM